ncbi:MAG: acyl-CoA thioesterase-2 [Candidatus Poriferisodalaceae bacterium]|jgi:acyl-CoA thioesterase-2
MGTAFDDLIILEKIADDRFLGPPAPEQGQRTYGGQLLAHTLRAAQATLPDVRAVHSAHSYFLRQGDVAEPTELVVERVRDGRSFSSRQVVALQQGKEIFRTLLSFHVPETGLEWEPPVKLDVPGPDDSGHTTYREFWNALLPAADPEWGGHERPIDIRYVNAPSIDDHSPVTEPQLMWIRVRDAVADDEDVWDVGLAYIADATLVDTVMLPHGKRWPDPRLSGASLDHAMWFHRRVDPHEWLLYDQRTEMTSGARGLARGRFFDQSGRLIATCVQEGLIRWSDVIG